MESLILILIGFITLVNGIITFVKNNNLIKKGKIVKGVVFKLEQKDITRRSLYPIIRFLNEKQEWITFQSAFATYPSPYTEGDEVEVIYDSEFPNEAEIYSKNKMQYLPILFIIGGIILIIVGCLHFLQIAI